MASPTIAAGASVIFRIAIAIAIGVGVDVDVDVDVAIDRPFALEPGLFSFGVDLLSLFPLMF